MKILNYILNLIENIPASFWGVVVGSFFSIAGVALTNRAGYKRLRAQFDHEREQKRKDREMALRNEIYLAAAEAIAEGTNAIARFANLNIPDDQLTKAYIEKAAAISKVHIIAKTKTVQALANLTGELQAVFLRLYTRRFELMVQKNQVKFIENQIDGFRKERDHILELIKQHNIEGIVDAHRWKVLGDNYDFEQKRIDEAISKRLVLLKVQYPKQVEFMQECVTETNKLSKLMVPLLAAAREELEVPLDEDNYRSLVDISISKQELAIKDFSQKCNEFMEQA